jgi:hypothetical protein
VGAALVALALTASSGAGPARSSSPGVTPVGSHTGKLLLQVTVGASGHGKFTSRGVVADTGLVAGEKRVSPKRVRLKLTMTGVGGTFRVLVLQTCGSARSTWTIVTGTKAYRGISGKGTGRGRIPCGRGASRVYLAGTAKRPVLPLALPGTYRGTHTSLNLRVTFDVVATGGALTNASFVQLIARCGSSKILFLSPKFNANYPIGTDKHFSFSENGYQVSGSFSTRAAKGTISYDSGGCHMDPVSWTAATPPPALPTVPSGRYCGFQLQGPGICLSATTDGWVANVTMGGNIRCISPDNPVFKISYDFDGVIVIRSDLTFHAELARIPLDGGGSMTWRITGKFDGQQGATGTGGFTAVSLFRDGKLYTCRSAVSAWTANLGH